jgi:hypothetical protein
MSDDTFAIDTTGDVAPGSYIATLVSWEPFALFEGADGSWSRTDPEDGTEPALRIAWTFALDDEPSQTVEGVTSRAWRTDAAKLRQWCKGLGFDIASGGRISADVLVGRVALVTVEVGKSGYSRVVAVNPAPTLKAK